MGWTKKSTWCTSATQTFHTHTHTKMGKKWRQSKKRKFFYGNRRGIRIRNNLNNVLTLWRVATSGKSTTYPFLSSHFPSLSFPLLHSLSFLFLFSTLLHTLSFLCSVMQINMWLAISICLVLQPCIKLCRGQSNPLLCWCVISMHLASQRSHKTQEFNQSLYIKSEK